MQSHKIDSGFHRSGECNCKKTTPRFPGEILLHLWRYGPDVTQIVSELRKRRKTIRPFDETRFQKELMTSGHTNVNSTREIILLLDSLGRYYRATIDFHPNNKVTVK